jgi:hypothetical protein
LNTPNDTGSKPVRADIFVDGHFKTNQAPFRSDISANGINAKAQRRKETFGMFNRMRCALASWRLGVKFLCRPAGAENYFGLWFYKYAAPDGAGGR